MRARTIIWLCIGLMLILCSYPARAQVSSSAPSVPIGMGFSPATVSSLAEGIPVFTIGDQLWVSSYYSGGILIQLANASGEVVANATLEPSSPYLLYTFSNTDDAGTWSLSTFTNGLSSAPTTTRFSVVGSGTVQPTLSSFTLSGDGQLAMNFSMPPSSSFDIGACLAADGLPGEINVTIPAGLGTGQLGMKSQNAQMSVELAGSVAQPFTFWAELHGEYSYQLGANSTVSKELEVASTSPVDVTAKFANTATSIQDELIPRPGRYEMRVFFESAQGLSVAETPVLMLNDSMLVSLAACPDANASLAPSFSITAPLSLSPSTWPRTLYTMYEVDGVEEYSILPLSIDPAELTLAASPWGKALTDSDVSIPPQAGLVVDLAKPDTFFLVASAYPAEVDVVLSPEVTQRVTIDAPFTAVQGNVSSGEVVVQTLANGAAISGADVSLGMNGTVVAEGSSTSGSVTLYVPAGSYSMSGMYRGYTSNGTVTVRVSDQSNATLDFPVPPQPTPPLLTYLLAATALLGVAVSGAVWVRAYRTKQP